MGAISRFATRKMTKDDFKTTGGRLGVVLAFPAFVAASASVGFFPVGTNIPILLGMCYGGHKLGRVLGDKLHTTTVKRASHPVESQPVPSAGVSDEPKTQSPRPGATRIARRGHEPRRDVEPEAFVESRRGAQGSDAFLDRVRANISDRYPVKGGRYGP